MMNKIDFQPMPKRFQLYSYMGNGKYWQVTTYKGRPIIIGLDGSLSVDGDRFLKYEFREALKKYPIIVCQSTNLFDKDSKEIFEGSIVKGKVSDDQKSRIFGVVVCRQQAFWIINVNETHSEPLLKFRENELENLGHILSNPELLEDKRRDA